MRSHVVHPPAVAIVLASLLGSSVLAGGVTVDPIPDPPFAGAGPPLGFGFDGDSLFGRVRPPSASDEAAYRWTATGGFELLPAGGPLGSDFLDADLESRTVAGIRFEPAAKAGGTHPTLLRAPTATPGNPIVDGLAVTGSWERTPVVSGSGKVILRTYRHPSPLELFGNVFAWSGDTGQWTERGGVPAPGGAPDHPTFVLDVDGSGMTFVGTYATSSSAVDPYGPGSRRPMVFRNGSFATLPVPTGSLDGFADRISTNGRAILGGTPDGLTQYLWRRSPTSGQFVISAIPVPSGGTQPRITSFTYNARLGLGTYRTSAGQVRTMIWRDIGGAIDAATWIDGLGLGALGWTGFEPERFSDDGRTLLGRATAGGVTQWVRIRGYDLAALLGPGPSLGEFAATPIVMPATAGSSITLDTRLFTEGRPQDAVVGDDIRDAFFAWTAPFAGRATAGHCATGSAAESQVTLAVLDAGGNRIAAGAAGSHPACATPNAAQVVFPASAGATYRIRVSLVDAQLGHDTFGTGASGLVISLAAVTGDLDGDGAVTAADLAMLLSAWGPSAGNPADLDGNGAVNAADLAIQLANWG
jgi:hypothetical protein